MRNELRWNWVRETPRKQATTVQKVGIEPKIIEKLISEEGIMALGKLVGVIRRTQYNNGIGGGDGSKDPKFLISPGPQGVSHGRKSWSTRGLSPLGRVRRRDQNFGFGSQFHIPLPFSRALEDPIAWWKGSTSESRERENRKLKVVKVRNGIRCTIFIGGEKRIWAVDLVVNERTWCILEIEPGYPRRQSGRLGVVTRV